MKHRVGKEQEKKKKCGKINSKEKEEELLSKELAVGESFEGERKSLVEERLTQAKICPDVGILHSLRTRIAKNRSVLNHTNTLKPSILFSPLLVLQNQAPER